MDTIVSELVANLIDAAEAWCAEGAQGASEPNRSALVDAADHLSSAAELLRGLKRDE